MENQIVTLTPGAIGQVRKIFEKEAKGPEFWFASKGDWRRFALAYPIRLILMKKKIRTSLIRSKTY